jgi:hypothetical protein
MKICCFAGYFRVGPTAPNKMPIKKEKETQVEHHIQNS